MDQEQEEAEQEEPEEEQDEDDPSGIAEDRTRADSVEGIHTWVVLAKLGARLGSCL